MLGGKPRHLAVARTAAALRGGVGYSAAASRRRRGIALN